jgi:hypothetical protein
MFQVLNEVFLCLWCSVMGQLTDINKGSGECACGILGRHRTPKQPYIVAPCHSAVTQ